MRQWGNLISQGGSATYTNLGRQNPLRYRGYFYDTDTGLYYLQSRYYNPEWGRFVNGDTSEVLTLDQGMMNQYNLYAYCANDPVNGVDPSGKFVITATVIGFSAFVLAGITFIGTYAILSNPDFQRSLSNTISILGNGVASLCDSIVKAVDSALKKAKEKSKNTKYEKHHIVAKKASKAYYSRQILKKVGIGIDSDANTVSINYNLHRHLHTNSYYNAVYNLLKKARVHGQYSKKRVKIILNYIKAVLKAASKAST